MTEVRGGYLRATTLRQVFSLLQLLGTMESLLWWLGM